MVIPFDGGAASHSSAAAVALGVGALDVGSLVMLPDGADMLFEGTGVIEVMDADGKGGRKLFEGIALGAVL